MLFFKKRFFDQLVSGEKTSTIRTHARCKVGDIVICLCGREKERVKITAIDKLSLNHLTLAIARTEGLVSKGQLKRVLMTLYPDKREFFYIQFELWHDH